MSICEDREVDTVLIFFYVDSRSSLSFFNDSALLSSHKKYRVIQEFGMDDE